MIQAWFKPCPDPVIIRSLPFSLLAHRTREIFIHLARISIILCLISSATLILYTAYSPPKTHWLRLPTQPTSPVPSRPHDTTATNISHILFGIGGSAATWRDRSSYSALWWDRNATRGFVWLDKDVKLTGVAGERAPPQRVQSSIWTRFRFSSSRSAVRISRIISESFKLNLGNVRWFVMGDDDTVYFAENLVTVLGKYDHNEMWYIGDDSESVEQDEMHGYDVAFGGGGFAVSYPLAEKLVRVLDGCLDRYYYFYGSDERIWGCMTEIGVPLTIERGFHQLDVRGNPYGLLAAHPTAPLVSLHHLDYLDPLFPKQTHIASLQFLQQAYRLDPPRILQQTFCQDRTRMWSISVSWGYTIQLYPFLLPANHLQRPLQTFKTWRSWTNGPFTFNTRPVETDPCKQPIIFMLDTASPRGTSGTLTTYKRDKVKLEKRCNKAHYTRAMLVERIAVSSMKLDADYWTKAPHRQCCEMMNQGRITNGTLQIRVRKCRQWETVSI